MTVVPYIVKGEHMAKLKSENPKITFRPSEILKYRFRRKCFTTNLSQDYVLIELIELWVKNKVAVREETKWVQGIKIKKGE